MSNKVTFYAVLFLVFVFSTQSLAKANLSTEEITKVSSCVSKITKLSFNGKIPTVVISKKKSLSSTVNSQELTTGEVKVGYVVGTYSHTTKQIVLSRDWTYPLLAHEITHYLQDSNGLMPNYPTLDQLKILETQAYEVQENFSYSCTDFWGNLK